MVSMKDVALACNVSVATVSKALNGHNDISEAKKTEIKLKAKEMGYLPNLSARALKTNRTYNIGVLFVDEARSGLTHDYFVAVLESFKVTAEKKGYDITFLNCNKSRSNRLSYLEHSKYRGFDGVVIACINFSDPEVVELINSDIPVVTIDHLFNNRIAIVSDNIKGMQDLVTYIYEQGHRKIAYIHGLESAVTSCRLSSFYKTTEELGLDIPDEYVKEAGYRDVATTAKKTKELLELKEPPTCIIFPDDYAAFGGINAIKKRGLRIPEDISVAGYDGIKVAKQIEPAITTLAQDTKKLGRFAAEKLIGLIEKPKTTLIEQVLVGGELIKGATVKKIETIN